MRVYLLKVPLRLRSLSDRSQVEDLLNSTESVQQRLPLDREGHSEPAWSGFVVGRSRSCKATDEGGVSADEVAGPADRKCRTHRGRHPHQATPGTPSSPARPSSNPSSSQVEPNKSVQRTYWPPRPLASQTTSAPARGPRPADACSPRETSRRTSCWTRWAR